MESVKKIVHMSNKELLLQYKKVYLQLKKTIMLIEVKALETDDYENIKLCQQQLRELEEEYQTTMQAFRTKN